MSVKVGLSQINNPTPKPLKTFFRWFSFLQGASAIVVAMLPQIPEHLKLQIVLVGSVGSALIHFAIKFFGLQDAGVTEQ